MSTPPVLPSLGFSSSDAPRDAARARRAAAEKGEASRRAAMSEARIDPVVLQSRFAKEEEEHKEFLRARRARGDSTVDAEREWQRHLKIQAAHERMMSEYVGDLPPLDPPDVQMFEEKERGAAEAAATAYELRELRAQYAQNEMAARARELPPLDARDTEDPDWWRRDAEPLPQRGHRRDAAAQSRSRALEDDWMSGSAGFRRQRERSKQPIEEDVA